MLPETEVLKTLHSVCPYLTCVVPVEKPPPPPTANFFLMSASRAYSFHCMLTAAVPQFMTSEAITVSYTLYEQNSGRKHTQT